MQLEQFYLILLLGVAVGVTSTTLTLSAMFKPIRIWVQARCSWLGDLTACPYCMSHWLALAAVAVWRPRLTSSWFLVDYLVSILAVVFVATLASGIVRLLSPFQADQQDDEFE